MFKSDASSLTLYVYFKKKTFTMHYKWVLLKRRKIVEHNLKMTTHYNIYCNSVVDLLGNSGTPTPDGIIYY